MVDAYNLDATQPIGVMDSGMGGISVLREIRNILPNEGIIFYGDSANAPYGDKKIEEINYLVENAIEILLQERVKAIVIACNTASSTTGSILRNKYPWLPIVAIEPAVKPAVLNKPNSRILVLATSTTLREQKFKRLIKSYENMAEIISMPLPGLPEFVERGELNSPRLREFLQEHFSKITGKIDSAVLGCTHYPFVRPVIQELLGKSVVIYDGSVGTARQLKRILAERKLLTSKSTKGDVKWENSSHDEKLITLADYLLNKV